MPRKTARSRPASLRRRPSFNEAAARCRGKPHAGRVALDGAGAASMRPRPDAAENRAGTTRPQTPSGGFNEAAARCRGKPSWVREYTDEGIWWLQ